MQEDKLGFDDFCEKWLPPRPAWAAKDEKPQWMRGESEDQRRQMYIDHMGQIGGDAFTFSESAGEKLKRDATAGEPIMAILDRLLKEPETSEKEAIAVLFQRVFGVPKSRAGFISSWNSSNRSEAATKILERIMICVFDAHRAGIWN